MGFFGQTGPAGPAGANGSNGSNGSNGADGTDGYSVLSGSGVPDPGLGVDGDFYINTAATTIYGPKAAGAWGSPTSLVGATGATGAAGSNGSNGSNGTNATTILASSTLGSDQTSVSLVPSSATLTAGKTWILEASIQNTQVSTATISLQFNTDSTGGNYNRESLSVSSTTVTGANGGNNNLVLTLPNGDFQTLWGTFFRQPNTAYTVGFVVQLRYDAGAGTMAFGLHGFVWKSTSAPASMQVVSSVASGLETGSWFQLRELTS